MNIKEKRLNSFGKKEEINVKQTKRLMFKESIFSIIKKYKKTGSTSCYEPIINYLKQKPLPSKLCCHWLIQLRDAIPLLDRDTEQLVIDTLHIPWQYGDDNIESHLRNFILNLVTGQSYFVPPILKCLFDQLIPIINDKNAEVLRVNPFQLSEEQQLANYKTIHLIQTISVHVPLCENVLLKTARSVCPYFKHHVHTHTVFTYNMLQLIKLMPKLRKQILEIILSNIIKLDLHCPRCELDDDSDAESDTGSEDLFSMEVDNDKVTPTPCIMSHPIGHSLDTLMTLVYRYIHFIIHGGKDLSRIMGSSDPFKVNGCRAGSATIQIVDCDSKVTNGCECEGKNHDVAAMKELYADLKQTFAKIILPTHSSSHVQFILFYTLAIRPSLVSDFVDFLKETFERPENSTEERKSAVAYLGSLLARGNFVKFSHVHHCLEILYNWCKSYLQSEFVHTNKYEDLQLHNNFYCACQTLFYVFTFNYKEYGASKARLKLAHSLHLDELVLSPLNPLRFCNQTITINFAAITRHYQLTYCYSVLENNCRLFLPISLQNSYGVFHAHSSTLDMLFPFDPYLLKRSDSFICEHYKEFEGLPEQVLSHSDNVNQNKEIIERENIDIDDGLFWSSPQSLKFSCEMSPGFKSS